MQDKNLRFLKKNVPQLHAYLKKISIDRSNYRIDTAKKEVAPFIEKKSGERWQPLHSKYSPQQEAINFVDKFDNYNTASGILIIGLGFGYHLQEIAKRNPNSKLFIIEPDPQVFLHAMEWIDLEQFPWGQLGTLVLGDGKSAYFDFATAIVDKISADWPIITLPSYEIAYPAFIQQLSEYLNDFRKRHHQIMTTTLGYERLWHINGLINLSFVEETNSLFTLQDNLKDKPVVIVGAGPSLDDAINLIREIKNNGSAYIFAVGSGLKALLSNGIIPDAFFSHDPTEANYQNLKDVLSNEITMFFASTTNFNILQHHVGAKYHFITVRDQLSRYYKPFEDNEVLNDSATIAHVALQAMLKMGASTVFLAGIDLAYRDNKRFAEGVSHNELNTSGLMTIMSNQDTIVFTDQSFESMRSEINYLISQYKNNSKIYNLSLTGAKIDGAPYMSPEDASLLLSIDNQVENLQGFTNKVHSIERLQEFYNKVHADLFDYQLRINQLIRESTKTDNGKVTWEEIEQFEKIQESNTFKNILKNMMEGRLTKFNRILFNNKHSDNPSPEMCNEFTVTLQEALFNIEVLLEVIEHLIQTKQ